MNAEEIALELTKAAMQNGLLNLPTEAVSSSEQFCRDRANCIAEAYATILNGVKSVISS